MGGVVNNALAHLRNKWSDKLTPEQRASAAASLQKTRDAMKVWGGDPKLAGLRTRLEETIDFQDNRETRKSMIAELGREEADRRLSQQFPDIEKYIRAYDGGSASMPDEMFDLTGNHRGDSFSQADTRYMLHATGLFESDYAESGYELGGETEGDGWRLADLMPGKPLGRGGFRLESDVAGGPSRLNEEKLARDYYTHNGQLGLIGGELHTQVGKSEYVKIPNLQEGNQFEVQVSPDETVNLTVDQDMIDRLASAKIGGALGHGILGKFVHGDEAVDTVYGKRLVPNITGNPLVDRDLYAKPEWQRAVELSRGGNIFGTKVAQTVTNVAEFAAIMAATRGAGRLAGKALAGPIGGAVEKLGRGKGIGRFAGRTAQVLGRNAAEGGRAGRKFIPPKMHRDAIQIVEEVYYESVRGLVTGDGDLGDWISSGVGEGVAEYGLGRAARVMRGSVGFAYGAGKLAIAARRAKPGAKVLDDIDPLISAGHKAITDARGKVAEATSDQLNRMARKGIVGAMGGEMRRKALVEGFDSLFVGHMFGAWEGAHVLAAEDGKDFSKMSGAEQFDYFRRGAKSQHAWASALGMAGYHGAFVLAATSRPGAMEGALSPDQREGVDHLSQYVVLQTQALAESPDGQAAVNDLFEGATTRQARELFIQESLARVRNRPPRDPDVGDLNAELFKQSGDALKRIWDAEEVQGQPGSEWVVDQLTGMPDEGLDFLEGELRDIDLDLPRSLRAGGQALDAIRHERNRRAEGGEVAQVDIPELQTVHDVGPPASLLEQFSEGVHHEKVGGRHFPHRILTVTDSKANVRVVEEKRTDGVGQWRVVRGKKRRAVTKRVQDSTFPLTEGGLHSAVKLALNHKDGAPKKPKEHKQSPIERTIFNLLLQGARFSETMGTNEAGLNQGTPAGRRKLISQPRKGSDPLPDMQSGYALVEGVMKQRYEQQKVIDEANRQEQNLLHQEATLEGQIERYIDIGKAQGRQVLEQWLGQTTNPTKVKALETALEDPGVKVRVTKKEQRAKEVKARKAAALERRVKKALEAVEAKDAKIRAEGGTDSKGVEWATFVGGGKLDSHYGPITVSQKKPKVKAESKPKPKKRLGARDMEGKLLHGTDSQENLESIGREGLRSGGTYVGEQAWESPYVLVYDQDKGDVLDPQTHHADDEYIAYGIGKRTPIAVLVVKPEDHWGVEDRRSTKELNNDLVAMVMDWAAERGITDEKEAWSAAFADRAMERKINKISSLAEISMNREDKAEEAGKEVEFTDREDFFDDAAKAFPGVPVYEYWNGDITETLEGAVLRRENLDTGSKPAKPPKDLDRAPTVKQLARAQKSIAYQLRHVAPYNLMPKGAERFEAFTDPEDSASLAQLDERVAEAKSLAAEAKKSLQPMVRTTKSEAERNTVEPLNQDKARTLWDDERQASYEAGWALTMPGRNKGGQAVEDAVSHGLDLTLQIAKGSAGAKAQQDAMIAGILVGLGGGPSTSAKSDKQVDLIASITGASPADVRAVQRQLGGPDGFQPTHQSDLAIENTMAQAVGDNGVRMLSELAVKRNIRRLRLIALGAPFPKDASGSERRRNGRGELFSADYSDRVERWWSETGRKAMAGRLNELVPGRSQNDNEVEAQEIWDQHSQGLLSGLHSVAKAKGLEVNDLYHSLRTSIRRGKAEVSSLDRATEDVFIQLAGSLPSAVDQGATGSIVDTKVGDSTVNVVDVAEAPTPGPRTGLHVTHHNLTQDVAKKLRAAFPEMKLEDRDIVGMLRRLADGDAVMAFDLGEHYSEEEVAEMATVAQEASAYAQLMLETNIAEVMERMGYAKIESAEQGRRLINAMLAAVSARSYEQPLAKKHSDTLKEHGIADENGDIKHGIETLVMKMASRAAASDLADVARAAGDMDGVDTADEVKERVLYMYGGIPPSAAMQVAAVFGWATGYYDRALDYPHRAHHEIVSDRGYLRVNRFLDWLNKDIGQPFWGTKAGRKLGRIVFGKKILPWWQVSVGRGKTGWSTKKVREGNVNRAHESIAGEVEAGEFVERASKLSRSLAAMKLTAFEAELIGKSIDANAMGRIKTRREWEGVFGKESGYLFEIAQETHQLLLDLGQSMVDNALIDPEAYEHLKTRYLPGAMLKWGYSKGGMGLRYNRSTDSGPRASSQEHSRVTTELVDDSLRSYDIRYLLPMTVSKGASRIRLFRALSGMVRGGTVITREEYDKLSWLDKSQFLRAANRGREGAIREGDEAAVKRAVLTEQELEAKREGELSPAEVEAILTEREEATTESAMLFEMIEAERREARSADRLLAPGMEKLLTDIEHGYVSRNSSIEIAMLVDQTDLDRSSSLGSGSKVLQQLTLDWRRLRTIQNPKHWFLQLGTNWVSNHVTGKVPMGDLVTSVLFGEGSYATGAENLVGYMDALAAGEKYEDMSDGERHFKDFADAVGSGTLIGSAYDPQNKADSLRSMLAHLQPAEPVPDETEAAREGEAAELRQVPFAKWGGEQVVKFTAHMTARMGRGFSTIDEFSKLTGDPNPEARAEGRFDLMNMYNMHELWWKYAAFINAEKIGLSGRQAVDWATEGTADFSNRNPWVARLSTQFSNMEGSLMRRGRGRASKKGHLDERRLGLVAGMARQGLASPFWIYRWTMWPGYAQASVSHPAKTVAGLAMATAMYQAVSAAFEDDPEEKDRVAEAQAGRKDLLHQGIDTEMDRYLRKHYGDRPSGVFGTTVSEWLDGVAAFSKHVAHGASLGLVGEYDPESGTRLTQGVGPSFGGDSSIINFGSFAESVSMGANVLPGNAWKLMNSKVNDRRPHPGHSAGIEEVGAGFMPVMAVAAAVRMYELASGVKGESRWVTFGKIVEDVLAETNAPLGGGALSALASREGQQFVRGAVAGGASLSDTWNNVPSAKIDPTGLEHIESAAARGIFPLLSVGTSSAEGYDTHLGKRALQFIGLDARSGRPDLDADHEADIRRKSIETAVLNLLDRSYKEYLDTGAPIELIHRRLFSYEGDLITNTSGASKSVIDNPRSELGRFIRKNGGADHDDRRLWLKAVEQQLEAHAPDMKRLLLGSGGITYRRDVDPAVFRRMLRATWRNVEEPGKLLNFLHAEAFDRKSMHDGVIHRLWFELGVNSMKGKVRDDGDLDRWLQMETWVKQRSSGVSPEYDVREEVGPQIYDVMPRRALKSLPKKPTTPGISRTLFPDLTGSVR